MQFGQLDISHDPESQGYELHSFDMVLGYNVVHATPRIRESIRNLGRLLAPGGLLGLVEATRLRRWDEMVWGLTEGWWLFEDDDLRTISPLISLNQWQDVLRGEGFDKVADVMEAIAVAERQHEKRYLALAANIDNGTVFVKDAPVVWRCRNCGYLYEGTEAPGVCIACSHPRAHFEVLGENW